MDYKDKSRIRMLSCIGTIIDVQETVSSEFENEDFFPQFEELKEAINGLDIGMVSESDVQMIEEATNTLLGEFKKIFEAGNLRPIYEAANN